MSGSTLSDLKSVYRADLVTDSADGWESPTGGLLASYSDVAAIINGDKALTFILDSSSIVTAVELSDAANWGDDEGCA